MTDRRSKNDGVTEMLKRDLADSHQRISVLGLENKRMKSEINSYQDEIERLKNRNLFDQKCDCSEFRKIVYEKFQVTYYCYDTGFRDFEEEGSVST